MKLNNACLCGNCDELFDRNLSRVCPACTSPHYLLLTKLLEPQPQEDGGWEEQKEEQKELPITDIVNAAQQAAPLTSMEQLNAVANKLLTKKGK